MRRFTITLPVFLVLSMLLSITAGLVYATYGWHNGLLFLLMFVVMLLSSQKIKNLSGPTAVAGLIPTYLEMVAATVVSVLCAYAGIHLGGGSQDFGALAYYAVTILLFGFLTVCVSVNHAVLAGDGLVSPVFKQFVIYFLAFVLGLAAVGIDSSSQYVAVIVDAVFTVVVSVLMIRSASKGSYY